MSVDELCKTNEDAVSLHKRVEALLCRELTFAENCDPGKIDKPALDAVAKLYTFHFKHMDYERKDAIMSGSVDFDRAKVFIENIAFFMDRIKELSPHSFRPVSEVLPEIFEEFKATLE